jgi:hypothetical protein
MEAFMRERDQKIRIMMDIAMDKKNDADYTKLLQEQFDYPRPIIQCDYLKEFQQHIMHLLYFEINTCKDGNMSDVCRKLAFRVAGIKADQFDRYMEELHARYKAIVPVENRD